MIRTVIFALALIVFCKLFLNQPEAPDLHADQVTPADEHTHTLAKDVVGDSKNESPKS